MIFHDTFYSSAKGPSINILLLLLFLSWSCIFFCICLFVYFYCIFFSVGGGGGRGGQQLKLSGYPLAIPREPAPFAENGGKIAETDVRRP